MSHVACLTVDIAMFQETVVATTSKVRGFLSEFGRGVCQVVNVSHIHWYSVESWLWVLHIHVKKENT